ncbi:hypothetical protein CYY_007192 [Polysphondylium violaceum]|uniref:Acid ceramidase-like protein n=1 Tax=Polysphondylium violaceum TaxID=133409 RepID=A0A8J4PQT8_9MYCE|nr:hypothetical protein CYY_007192 [Polysphondylium violaceum]
MMMKLFVSIFVTIALVLSSQNNYYGVQAVCNGVPNVNGIWNDTLVFNSSVENGKLYTAGSLGNQVPVVHVYGTPYEMGYAQGLLLKTQIQYVYANIFKYFDKEIAGFSGVPEWAVKIIEDGGLSLVLDMVAFGVKDHTPERFFQEIQGIADATGVDKDEIIRVHMIPELLRASCSMFGGWGSATPNGGLLQLRALDWVVDSPLTVNPAVVVYHPSEGGHPFTILSWAGFIGSLTGYSGYTGVSEKVWANYNGTFNRFGTPFYYVMRDILQFDTTVDQAIDRIFNTKRTCAVYMGVGSNSTNTFTAVEYSYDTVRIFDDTTPFPIYSPQPAPHELIKNVVYIDPDYKSAQDQCMTDLLNKYYGDLTTENTQQLIALLQTGNTHAAIYDYALNTFTVSVATQTGSWPVTSPIANAYTRQFIKLDATQLFNEPKP